MQINNALDDNRNNRRITQIACTILLDYISQSRNLCSLCEYAIAGEILGDYRCTAHKNIEVVDYFQDCIPGILKKCEKQPLISDEDFSEILNSFQGKGVNANADK